MHKLPLWCKPCLWIAAISLALSSSASAQDTSPANAAPPPPPAPLGKMVDVGGWRLHVNCTGQDHAAGPTVVLENGAGDFSFVWHLVQTQVAKFAQVVSYDRAGDAWSDVGPRPRTMKQIAYELHTALANAGIKGPYILVGQSIGGLYVRVFAQEYPGEVAGMVLVDSTHEDAVLGINGKMQRAARLTSQGRPIPSVQKTIADADKELTAKKILEAQKFVKARIRPKNNPPFDTFPPEIQRARLWALAQPAHYTGDYEDYTGEDFAALFATRQARPYALGDKPLMILIAGKEEKSPPPPPGQSQEQWNEQLRQLAEEKLQQKAALENLSHNSKAIVDKNATHQMHLDDPDFVTDAIRQVMDAARTGRKL